MIAEMLKIINFIIYYSFFIGNDCQSQTLRKILISIKYL